MASSETPRRPSYRDEVALVRHLATVLEDRLAGRDSDRRVNVHPLDWCYLGVLGPRKPEPAAIELDEQQPDVTPDPASDVPQPADAIAGKEAAVVAAPLENAPQLETISDGRGDAGDKVEHREGVRRPPSALGFEVLVEPDQDGVAELLVDAAFCIFTKHLPTHAEQAMVLGTEGGSDGLPLGEIVQRWPVTVTGTSLEVRPESSHVVSDAGAIQAAIDAALMNAFARPDVARAWPGTRPTVRSDALRDDTTFTQFLASITGGLKTDQWQLHGALELRSSRREDGRIRLGCYLRNDTPATGVGYQDAFAVIADARLSAVVQRGTLVPVEILPVPEDYQFDRRVWAVGHNTSVAVSDDRSKLRTAALATYEQPRVITRDRPPASFEALASDPIPTLSAIHDAMTAYAADWTNRVIAENALSLAPKPLDACRSDLQGFLSEQEHFASGLAALRADRRLLQAFMAMNRVFGRLAKGYDAWRLFQVVFIVSQLPSLAIREGLDEGEFPEGVRRTWTSVLDEGDVLWFKTGGGKTEAYLGLSCCAMLYDRMRGKSFGVTAWLRFPLRMLSVQQLQRAMSVVWETERERLSLLGTSANQSDAFRLGYFVGATTTPNSLSDDELKKYGSSEAREALRVVPDCPSCKARGTVVVSVDQQASLFRHRCLACASELPLDISDDEVYRHLPALLVGTVDKMASIGQQWKFGMLWGGTRWRCPSHGYAFGDYCLVFGCKVDKKKRVRVSPYDGPPSLHVQDELHLLQEELGAFAGHYETLIRHCEGAVSTRPSKVVAATATIEGFEHQVRHLYGVRNARRFPGRGYDRLATFYAEPETDSGGHLHTARVFAAFRCLGNSADASAFCAEVLHAEIDSLIVEPGRALAFLHDCRTEADVHALMRYYTTSLNYVGSLQRGSRVSQALEQIADRAVPGAGRELNVEYHSSRSTGAEVAQLVHRVESPPERQSEDFLDAIVATNMISHGVDLERINVMIMDGVPDQVAEYIQASSRSGRKHVGLVVVALPAYSLRATSIYHRFAEYHAHLDRMVSPVPVNRFAKYAADRTLPGIAIGLLYGSRMPKTGSTKLKERYHASVLLEALGPALMTEVKGAYAIGQGVYDSSLEAGLVESLERGLDVIRLSIKSSHEKAVRDAVRPAPMRSLRDVEAGVPFQPDVDYRILQWLQKARE